MSAKAIAKKNIVVENLKEKISRSKVVVVTDFLGFSVKDITTLRRKLRAANAEFSVVKNTLISRAVTESGFPKLSEHLKGPTAMLLGYDDAVAPLKVLVGFLKEAEKGSIRIGVVEQDVFGEKDLASISKLPSKEILLGKAVGGLKSPLYGLVNVLQGPIRKLVYVLDGIKDKKGGA
ncbi:MAG: 50S ribosomal protein L10 [bacterium]